MPFVDPSTAQAYRDAWETWKKQVDHLHRVFLEGEAIRPDQIKGLLNREARAKEAYDAARLRLLGIEASLLARAHRHLVETRFAEIRITLPYCPSGG